MRKTYILDTNVLISDPKCLNNFQDNDLIIPILVLEELDNHKVRSDEVGRSVREISRTLDTLCAGQDISKGVLLPAGGTLKILSAPSGYASLLPEELRQGSSVDNMIIEFVLRIKNELPNVVLVSKDINVRIKCSSLGIVSQDYLSLRVSHDIDSMYTGVKVINTTTDIINDIYAGGSHDIDEVTSEKTFANQVIVLKSIDSEGNTLRSVLVRRDVSGRLNHLSKHDNIFGLKPRNKEQIFSIDLLMDPSIKLITLTGRAGCGKTLLAIAAGLEQLDTIGTKSLYKKLVVSRPVQPVGRDIGFLPGTLAEKMEPWIAPVKDNLEFLLGSPRKNSRQRKKTDENNSPTLFRNPYLDLMQQKGLIEIEAISFIRGRSIPDAFIIIDEAQNLSIHELKTIITRAGEGTKIVLTGDVEQIDNVHVDTFTNGLSYAVERFKEYDIAGHVTLLKGERSELATLASKIL